MQCLIIGKMSQKYDKIAKTLEYLMHNTFSSKRCAKCLALTRKPLNCRLNHNNCYLFVCVQEILRLEKSLADNQEKLGDSENTRVRLEKELESMADLSSRVSTQLEIDALFAFR